MKVTVDPLECGCSGYCVQLLPDVFGWLPNGSAADVHSPPADDRARRLAHEAAELCPAQAIRISDEGADHG